MAQIDWKERERIRREAMQRVVGAFEAIELIRHYHASSASGQGEVEKILGYLESWGRQQPQEAGFLALHMAIALRVSLLASASAPSVYGTVISDWNKIAYDTESE